MEESVDYLKGKIAGLELLSKMFSELVVAAGGFDTSNELNARMRLTANIDSLVKTCFEEVPAIQHCQGRMTVNDAGPLVHLDNE